MSLHPIHPWVLSHDAPLYVLRYPAYDEADAPAVRRYADEHQALYVALDAWRRSRTASFAFLIDLSKVRSTAMNRQRAIQYLERMRERGSPHLACIGFVTPNEEVRGVMTAVFWQAPPEYPHQFFAELEDAKTWAGEHVRLSAVPSVRHTGRPSRPQ